MRTHSILRTLSIAGLLGASALAAGLVSALSWPAASAAFTTTGESLGLDQRDFRVFNNFTDPLANENNVPHPNFPGTGGAVMAIAKAHAEWGSGPRAGNGFGDGLASNLVLGSGGANFDNTYQGVVFSAGGSNDNVHSAASLGGAIVSIVETPASDGWKITYNEDFLWDDGPGAPADGALDLQAVATHEIGHVLGLGHSNVGGATMAPTISGDGTNQRSLSADDIAGLQAIYGAASATKPLITALAGPLDTGSTLVVTGGNFAPAGNELWFTQPGGGGTPLKVIGVASTVGGTQLSATIPAGAGSGELLVKVPGTSGAALSNAFPIEIDAPNGVYALTGPSLAGQIGLPQLTADGDLTPGGAGFTFYIQLVRPLAFGYLFVSFSEANLPFKGGIFDPAPIVAQMVVGVDTAGQFSFGRTPIPAGPYSGLSLVTQAWFTDPAAVQGFSATNGLRLTVE